MSTEALSLAERVQRLEDVERIWRLFMEYRRHLDRRDFGAYSRLFADDGEWTGNLGHAKGPAEIEALLDRTLDHWDGAERASYHLMANPVVEVDGDRATAESTWVYLTRDEEDKPVLSLLGHYEDTLVRRDGRWLFQRRVAYCDVPYDRLGRGR